MGVVFALKQGRFTAEDEPHAGHPLKAFIRRRGDRIASNFRKVERNRAEGAHGVNQQPPVPCRDDSGDSLNRIEYAGRRLTMNDNDMADIRIVIENGFHGR